MTSVRPSGERDLDAIARDVLLDFLGRSPRADDDEFELLCARRPELADKLRESWARERGAPDSRPARMTQANPSLEPVAERLQQFAAPIARGARYREEELIARGGMGAIHRVWDVELERALAMKVMTLGASSRTGALSPASAEPVARFLGEARVTAQLDHPGIVPVHELGIDARGRLFFIMKLVEGRDLRRVFELAWNGAEGWSITRAASVLLKVCEALVYAHSKGVIHRDLKPANVMVGRYGEVYVMDWGVARFVRATAGIDTTALAGARERADGSSDDPTLTSAGEVLGTPAYMSPEQARGDDARLSPRSDVYSVGAMLYHLLARRAPFADASTTLGTRELIERLLAGPPRLLRECEPRAPLELVAICDKAMARDLDQRYASMAQLAEDLRAYLEGRVVLAHRSGVLARLEKWIARNRGLAATLAMTMVLAVIGFFALRSSRASRANLVLLEQLREPVELMLEYDELWPPTPRKAQAMHSWLAKAEHVAAQRADYHAELDRLRAHALPFDPNTPLDRKERRPGELSMARADYLIEYCRRQIDRLRLEGGQTCEGKSVSELEQEIESKSRAKAGIAAREHERRTWRFTNPTDELVHDRLAEIVPLVDRIATPVRGASSIERVRRAARFVEEIERRSIDDARDAWRDVIASIGDVRECPQYRGLALKPQLGLVPLGRDPRSGLWEFAHLASGEAPTRDARGELVLTDDACIVLVLLPGGCATIGSQNESPEQPNYDPNSQADERPLFTLTIEPFFMSKYELTQSQWRHWTDSDPSGLRAPLAKYPRVTPRNPVETVAWGDAVQVMRELALTLPSEAQWEYAARAGTETAWSTGSDQRSLAGAANLLDKDALDRGFQSERYRDPHDFDRDGWETHAPVGSFAPNRFGLHDVHGNVGEWCRDSGESEYEPSYYFGSGERQALDEGSHTVRGGDFVHSGLYARSAARRQLGEHYVRGWVGLRPSRELDR